MCDRPLENFGILSLSSPISNGTALVLKKFLGSHRNKMSGLFGGRDPFDDPFFTRQSSNLFGSSMFGSASAHDPSLAHRSKAPVIQELDCEQMLRYQDDNAGEGDKYKENTWANKNPHVEHPDDETDVHNNTSKSSSKNTCGTDHSEMGGKQGQQCGVSFQKVTYGGINGPYYTASTTRRTGSDGMVLEENQQADGTTGQATHRISRGIHDKECSLSANSFILQNSSLAQGHSVTRKLNSDGKVDTMQTLHNLDEDELASFEESWKGNADRLPPGWIGRVNSRMNSGATGALPFRQHFGRQVGQQPVRDMQAHSTSTGGRPKKVVTIPIG